jgi:MFS family permease
VTPLVRSLPRVAAYTWRLHWPAALLIGAANAIVMMGGFVFKRSLGGAEKGVPWLIATWQASWILTPLVSAWLARVDPQRAWRAIGIAAGTPLVLVALVQVEPVDGGLPGQGVGPEWIFVGLLALHFLVSAFYIPHRGGLMRANYPADVRGRIYGLREMLGIAAALAVAYVASRLLDSDPRMLRVLFPVAGIFVASACWFKGRIRWRHNGRHRRSIPRAGQLREVLRDRRFMVYELAFMLYGFGFLMSWPLHIVFMEDELRFSYKEVAWAQSYAFPILQIAAMGLWGRFADRRGVVRSTAFSFLALTAFLLCMPFVTGFWSLLAAFGLFGAAMSGVMIGWSLGPIHFAPDGRAHAYTAVHFCCVGIRSVIAPFLGLWIKDRAGSFAAGYLAAAAFVAVATVLLLLLARGEHAETA